MGRAGIAKFDSSSAMLQALARALDGRDFRGLGQGALLQFFVRRAGWLPRRLRQRAFARLGAREGLERAELAGLRTEAVADWIQGQYSTRRYPAVMVGSSNGALLHLAAALGIPWLPQTFLTLVRQEQVHPDDAVQAMQAEQHEGARFVAANPISQLHHMHDPAQDRLMLPLVTYYRSKFRSLPHPYVEFLERSLAPGGTLIVVECDCRWPVKRLGERQVYQFGAVGGPTKEEYFGGSERVAAYLAREGSPRRAWAPPRPDDESAEAEWGFEPALLDSLREHARRRGYRLLRLRFADPEDPSPLVARFYREWNAARGITESRLVIESFIVLEPYWVLRTGAVPYWMTFNMQPSLERVHRYLDQTSSFDEIFLMLFAHGVESVGLPPIDEWQKLLARAGRRGELLGIAPKRYPAHFASFARYSQALRKAVRERYPLPAPVPLDCVERFLAAQGPAYGVTLERE